MRVKEKTSKSYKVYFDTLKISHFPVEFKNTKRKNYSFRIQEDWNCLKLKCEDKASIDH